MVTANAARRLEGRRALITGGASGMGLAIARRFLDEGASVAVVDLADDTLRKVAAELEHHGRITAIQGDTSNLSDVDRAVECAVAEFGGLDVLVNNAGVFDYNAPCEELDANSWDRLMAINVRGYAFMMKRALSEMLPIGRGAIVNNCSVNALIAGGGGAAYAASKGSVLALNRQVAFEVGSRGIRVNAVAPGAIDTNLFANTSSIIGAKPHGPMQARFHADMVKNSVPSIPLGRTADGSEVAPLVAFLASDDASYITGEVVVIDGGYSIH